MSTTPLNISPLADAGDALAGKGAGEDVELAIARFDGASLDFIAETLVKIESAKKRASEWEAAAKAKLTEIIVASGRKAMEIGPDLWQLKHPKTVKCRDNAKTYDAALTLAGGDMEAMARDFLSSNAWKYGAIREALQDDAKFDELFETKVDTTVERKLVKTDKKFIR